MGVGKSSVARHLAHALRCTRVDLDVVIEESEARSIPEIIRTEGIDGYRIAETRSLRTLLSSMPPHILSLGGGTWTIPENRELIKSKGFIAIWLESSFEHCWRNIKKSRKERPLAADKTVAKALFEARQKDYCLADWHLVVRPSDTSYDVACQIVDELGY